MNTMKVKSILPYFGGKRTLAPAIVKELGPHAAYWEPFCGSLAVLLAKEKSATETVSDLHGKVTTLARVLASDECPELYDTMSRTVFSEALAQDARERLASGEQLSDLTTACCVLVEAWMGRNGGSGTKASNHGFCVRYTSNGGDPAVRFRAVAESIPAWHERLRGVTILNRDAFSLLQRIEDKQGTVIYADPPYLVKGAKYVHDFTNDDHDRLAELLARFKKTRVVLSYYDHPRLDELYPGWTKVHLKATKALVNQGMRDKGGATKAPEVLLINGLSYTQPQGNGGLFA